MTEDYPLENGMRIIQETVPGRQVTLAHIIASPDPILYQKLGLDPSLDYDKAAIGISTVTPSETAVIMADIAMKSSGAQIGFVDRFNGSLIITGDVAGVEAALHDVMSVLCDQMGFASAPITRS